MKIIHHTKHFLRTIYHKIKLTTPGAIILAAIILGGSHIGYGALMSSGTKTGSATPFLGKAIDASDLETGKVKSKVVLVEYSDTECPFCAQLYPTITRIKQEYADKIGFVYRYFPLTQIHPHSFEESRAVYCVGKLLGAAKRDEYINEMFTYKTSKQNMVLPEGGKESMAKNVGVNDTEFKACLTSKESSDAITASMQDGVAAGVQGTPASFILIKNKKGYNVVSMVDGARPYEYFKAAIDQALAQ
jgi:protein-disulfide isomerase